MAELGPHHDGSTLYVSNPAPSLGDVVQVQVRIPQSFGQVEAVHIRSNPNHEPRFSAARKVASADGWDWWEAPVEVENPEHGYRFLFLLADGRSAWLNARGLHWVETLDAEDFLLVTYPAPPEWGARSVMYEVFPDRFARSAAADDRTPPAWARPARWSDPVVDRGPDTPLQFYGGDLAGVTEHLDHLEKLGVNLLYLTPVFPAASNHRYNAESFSEVDPLLGGSEAFIELVEAAHARGIRVIGDLTSNHSGREHEWFQTALHDKESAERDFYYWLPPKSPGGHNDYVAWLGEKSLPKFNWASAELRRRFIEGPDSVVAKWLKPPYNLDGWRIDVANMTGRYRDEDLNQEVRRIIRQTMIDVNPDTILLGESTNDATSDFRGDAWHGPMSYANFTRPIWGWLSKPGNTAQYFGQPLHGIPSYSGVQVHEAYTAYTSGLPWRVRQNAMNALDTHDTPRFLTNAIDGSVPVALGLSVTLPGIPVVFAGDEFGLTGVDGEDSRTPLPWTSIDDAAETIELYSALIRLRTAHPVLSVGGMRWIHIGDDVLAFARESAEESILIVASREDFELAIAPHAVAGLEGAKLLYGTAVSDSVIRGTGPTFSAWSLPGVAPRRR
ncbi:MAG TPA: glycoside hydrolase family 13 protein [Terrimesophilobacter sp.]|uniref:glycoside hydrolase family 13 protein n=1 Tax=Terrimesophilobacter sp. TaxID=2906435 RepID=UPI002F92E4B2